MPTPWNDATDRQLLLTIIHLLSPSPPKWEEVANLMGEGFTAESTRQHYQKLRKGIVGGSQAPGTPSNKPNTTPRGKAKKAGSEAATSKRKAGKTSQGGTSTISPEAEVDDEESPSKKVKGMTTVKMEKADDDEIEEYEEYL